MKKPVIAAFVAIATFGAFCAAQAAQVYSWVDDKGVTHYSHQPPRSEKGTGDFTMVDTVFSPSELKAIQKIKEEKQKLAQQKDEQNKRDIIRGCQDLHNEKIRYYRRKIEDTYIANLNKCDMAAQGLSASKARTKKNSCYTDALKVKMADIAQLPTEDDCDPNTKQRSKRK